MEEHFYMIEMYMDHFGIQFRSTPFLVAAIGEHVFKKSESGCSVIERPTGYEVLIWHDRFLGLDYVNLLAEGVPNTLVSAVVRCGQCGVSTVDRSCGACGKVQYCGEDCAAAHWENGEHWRVCGK